MIILETKQTSIILENGPVQKDKVEEFTRHHENIYLYNFDPPLNPNSLQ